MNNDSQFPAFRRFFPFRGSIYPRPEPTPTSVLGDFLGSSFKERDDFRARFLRGGEDESENEIRVSEGIPNITINPLGAFDVKDDKVVSGLPSFPSRCSRWFYPFDFQGRRPRGSRIEQLFSLLLDHLRR